MTEFTPKQGQYLAFIYYFTKLNGVPPAHADLQRHFGTTPPTVQNMVVRLHELGLIDRQPGVARSLKVLVPVSDLPEEW